MHFVKIVYTRRRRRRRRRRQQPLTTAIASFMMCATSILRYNISAGMLFLSFFDPLLYFPYFLLSSPLLPPYNEGWSVNKHNTPQHYKVSPIHQYIHQTNAVEKVRWKVKSLIFIYNFFCVKLITWYCIITIWKIKWIPSNLQQAAGPIPRPPPLSPCTIIWMDSVFRLYAFAIACCMYN